MATWQGASSTLTEQAKRREFDRLTGWVLVRTWEGPESLVAAKEAELILDAGVTRVRTTEGEPATVEATYIDQDGGTGAYIDEDGGVWELVPVDLDEPIAKNTNIMRAYSDGTTPDVLEAIEQALRKGTAMEQTWADGSGNLYDVYAELRAMGVDTFWTHSWIIRHSWLARKESDIQLATGSVGKVVAYSAINVPAGAKWQQPTIHQYSSGWVDTPVNQWLKKAPSVRWNGRSHDVSVEWWGALAWSQNLYDGGTGDP